MPAIIVNGVANGVLSFSPKDAPYEQVSALISGSAASGALVGSSAKELTEELAQPINENPAETDADKQPLLAGQIEDKNSDANTRFGFFNTTKANFDEKVTAIFKKP